MWLKRIGIGFGLLLAAIAVFLLVRSEPLGPLAGGKLGGAELASFANWDECQNHFTVYVEVQPEDPHSVTTLCFQYQDDLIIPAQGGSEKSWPAMVLKDPRVRIKMGEQIYLGHATRAQDISIETLQSQVVEKYPQFADAQPDDVEDVWLFRVTKRP